jgi:hypothetical protein
MRGNNGLSAHMHVVYNLESLQSITAEEFFFDSLDFGLGLSEGTRCQ